MWLDHQYKNGNYTVMLFDDGTKVRILDDGETEYKPEFPENIDCCISKKCSIGCKFCYENCTASGEECDPWIMKYLFQIKEYFRPGTEIALGGGALTEMNYFNLTTLLTYLGIYQLRINLTLNAAELFNGSLLAQNLYKDRCSEYIRGIGISYNVKYRDDILRYKKKYPKNVVVHTIYGVTSPEDYQWLAENHFKVLVLGYKNKGRGRINKEQCFNPEYAKWTSENILSYQSKFSTLSFDCLAVEQLNIKEKVEDDIWQTFYMGDDGKFTMYMDAVSKEFAPSSTSEIRYKMEDFGYKIENMFKKIINE